MAFLEERLSVDIIYGAQYGDDYAVDITKTSAGSEYRRLIHPFPQRTFRVSYQRDTAVLYAQLLNLYHRVYGRFAGFRAKCLDDYTTKNETAAPTATDQVSSLVSTGVYQLQKAYGLDATPLGIGCPIRTLFKPVAGTVLVAISGVTVAGSGWTVDTTTGKVTFATNKTATITGITKASSAVISCAGHTFVVGESVYISGVAGMTQINGLRALITATTPSVSITVSINSTAFSTYTSGGVANTRPQTGEIVTGGCEFDIPVRFDSTLDVSQAYPLTRDVGDISLVELLNP